MPKISVIMPAFKAKYLADAIQSVLNQTYTNFELIIVNDKSQEDLTSIVESFFDPRIKYYINPENLGSTDIVANWNKCLSYATGDFFSLICDDDLYEPTFLETMLSLADKYPNCNVFHSGVKLINAAQKVYSFYPSCPDWESCEEFIWHSLNRFRWQTVSEWFYRTEPIKALGGYYSLPLAWHSDVLSTILFCREGGIASTTQHLVTFRMSGDNITSQWSSNAFKKMQATALFEDKLKKIIAESNFDNPELLYPLLDKYVKNSRSFLLSCFSIKTITKCYKRRKEFRISSKMILKSIIFKLVH